MQTSRDYSIPVFVVVNGSITDYTFAEYLHKFWSDPVTSPRGIVPKRNVHAVITDEYGNVLDHSSNADELTPPPGYRKMWAVYEWGAWGIAHFGPLIRDSDFYETKDEAERDWLENAHADMIGANDNTPLPFFTRAEAEKYLFENS